MSTIEVIQPYKLIYETDDCNIMLVKQYFILESNFLGFNLNDHNYLLYIQKSGDHKKKNLYNEYTILRNINSKYVISTFGYNNITNTLTLEYIPGYNLINYINNNSINKINFRIFAKQLIKSIKVVHDSGYIHRDIKPDNFIVTGNAKIKLIDFEYAIKIGESCSLCGTKEYVPPEVAIECLEKVKETNVFSVKTDIWSLGVTLFCTKYGKSPFLGTSISDTFNRIINIDIPYEGTDFGDLLKGMLNKDPSLRYSMDDIINSKYYRKIDL